MMKRLFCFLLILVLCFSFAHAEEAAPAPTALRYDLDLTFSLNPDAFPARSRSRARGYAELLGVLELRGDLTICEKTQSFDLNAELFFRNKPEVSIPFRFYGVPSMLFLTSPIIADETLLFLMASLAEFAIKAKKNLETQLPVFALLYPYVYEYNFRNVIDAWNQYTGPAGKSRKISAENISKLCDTLTELLETDSSLGVWISTLYSVCSAPEAVEAEIQGIPSYLRDFVSAGKPLTVKVGDGSETWENAAGRVLFSRRQTDQSLTWSLDLPQDENRYAPRLSFTSSTGEGGLDFNMEGSLVRGKAVLPSEIDEESSETDGKSAEYAEEYAEDYSEEYAPVTGSEDSEGEYESEEDAQWPETLFLFSASGSSIPTVFPCDSSFSLAASVQGKLYPNFDLLIRGETKKDGTVSVSLCQPQENADPLPLLTCSGSVMPGTAETVPDFNYSNEGLYGNYNFFSFSEYYVAKFKAAVTKSLLKGLLDFVAEAPTSACQSILDDLTDAGVINMMIDQ